MIIVEKPGFYNAIVEWIPESAIFDPVRDGLGICTYDGSIFPAAVKSFLSQTEQINLGLLIKKQTQNAEKPLKQAVFQGKMVGVTGFEPAA